MSSLEQLPEDLQWYIWKTYKSQFVNDEVVSSHFSVWENPSERLLELCKDVGCIQHGHNELPDLIEDHNMWCWNDCVDLKCENCRCYGFPCDNLAVYGFNNINLAGQWDAQFA